jgi:flagellar biosynthesis chaperone FliJ
MGSPLPSLDAPHPSPSIGSLTASLLSLNDTDLHLNELSASTAQRRENAAEFVLDNKILELAKRRDSYAQDKAKPLAAQITQNQKMKLKSFVEETETTPQVVEDSEDRYLHEWVQRAALSMLMDESPEMQQQFRSKLTTDTVGSIAVLIRNYVDYQLRPVLEDKVKSSAASAKKSTTPSSAKKKGTKRKPSDDVEAGSDTEQKKRPAKKTKRKSQ